MSAVDCQTAILGTSTKAVGGSMETDQRKSVRWLHVAGLALVAFVVSTALGSPDLGLFLAGAIVVCELLWGTGSLVVRSWRQQHVER
jgi:uncharacterized membrane protein YdcZ (DUF606 family)